MKHKALIKSREVCISSEISFPDYDIVDYRGVDVRPFDLEMNWVSERDGGTDILNYIREAEQYGARLVIFDLKSRLVITL